MHVKSSGKRHVNRTLLLAASALAGLLAAGCASTAGEAPPVTQAAAPQPISPVPPTPPLLAAWEGPYGGVPPWDKVKPADFPQAFEGAIWQFESEISLIANNSAPATFENTLAAMERAGRTLDRVSSMFGVFQSNLADDEVQALDKDWSPKLAALSDRVTFNEKLFARVAAVYAARESLGPEERRLTERSYASFKRNGAELDAGGKARLAEINQELAGLFAEFSSRVLKDEETWIVLGEGDLAGLSESYKAAAKAAAAERGVEGFVVVNTRSSVDPFLSFSTRRDLREKVYKAFKNRGDNGDAEDTNALIAEITQLRAERAKLLGFPTHAHYRMDDTMAKDPAKAEALMQRVWKPAVARVKEEVADMAAIARKEGFKGAIEPWDYRFYAEKVRKAKYDLDESEIKPYFELQNMTKAAFWTAEQLYGLTFTEITGQVPAFHPDVQVYEVKDKASGRHVGLFYGDNYARSGKRSGAWMTSYRIYETFDGARTPLVSNNNNFVKGAPGEPVLISLDDARTLFHEFGHALHYLLSTAAYPGLTNTPRDYVEYPSQVMEHWVLTRPVLDRFARHYQTGEPMPQAVLDKVTRSEKFNQGYETVEFLGSAIVDMALHNRPEGVADPKAFERETLAALGMPKEVQMRHRLPQFNHLFASDAYSAGYYSYLWSEVMDADTWKAFEEAGNVFDPELARKMKDIILAPGNSSDRAEAFRQFRGRDPDVNALLQVRGFPAN